MWSSPVTAVRNAIVSFAVAASLGPPSAFALAPALRIGVDGWRLETFGTDVAVLRAPASQDAKSGGEVEVLLSCSGMERRARLKFPAPLPDGPVRADHGLVLITSAGKVRGQPFTVGRFDLAPPSTIVLSGLASSRVEWVRALGQMLLARPVALDVLVRFGTGPVAFMHIVSYRLVLTLGALDDLSIRRFIAVCDNAKIDKAG